MKITFFTTPQGIEFANQILKQAIEDLMISPEDRDVFNLSLKDLKEAEKMRLSLLKGFTKPIVAKKKKAKAVEKKAKHSCYTGFIKIYWDWFNYVEKMPPNIDFVAGAAANKIIDYLKTIVKNRYKHNNEPGEITEEELNIRVLESWNVILSSWGSLEKFLKEKTKLSDIYSNIQNIILKIKNAARNQSNGRATAGGTMQAISDKFNKANSNNARKS